MQVNFNWLETIVAQHCPEFHLHPDDKYMPCSADFFVVNSELIAVRDGKLVVCVEEGGLDGQSLLVHQENLVKEGCSSFRMRLKPSARRGQDPSALDEIPVYAHAKAIQSRRGASPWIEAIEINYITIYPYNGEYTVAGMCFHISFRNHKSLATPSWGTSD